MARRLFTVEDTFTVAGRDLLVLFPGMIIDGEERYRIGDRVLLRRPDNSASEARIGGLELPTPNPRYEVLVLLKGLAKGDVPIGTEVWSTDDQSDFQEDVEWHRHKPEAQAKVDRI